MASGSNDVAESARGTASRASEHIELQDVTTYLSDMSATSATIGWGGLGRDVSVSTAPLRLNGVTYLKGLGTHANSEILYYLAGNCSRFEAVVGVDDAVTSGSVRFQVLADGVLLFDSDEVLGGSMTGDMPGQAVSVDVSATYELSLVVTDGGDGIGSDHADWADARVVCGAGFPPLPVDPPLPPASGTTYVSDLAAKYATIGWGALGKDASVSGTRLSLNAVTYDKGIGTHANSDIRYHLGGNCSRFEAVVGVDDQKTGGSIRFQVRADGVLLFSSYQVLGQNMTGGMPGLPVSVDISGKQEVALIVTDGGNGIGSDHADWADARVTCGPPVPPVEPPPVHTAYLSDMAEMYATIGWGVLGKDVSVSGTPLRLNGVTYAKGLGTHANSEIRYHLGGGCSRFEAIVGVDDEKAGGSVRFQVWADGALLFDSYQVLGQNMTGDMAGLPVSVDVSGKRELSLVVTDGADGIGSDHADWADAKATCAAGGVSAVSAKFAYWNVAGGNGVKHLDAINFANPAQPFGCKSTSGENVDDRFYGDGSGAAILQANGAMREALIEHLANDPEVVAFGVGESWAAGTPPTIASILGWPRAGITNGYNGGAILTRYGFTAQGISPVLAPTDPELRKAIYANVCLTAECTRTLPFFALHNQAPQGDYDDSIVKLLEYVDSIVPSGARRIIMGDFNAWDNTTDPHLCVSNIEPGPSHEAGIRRLKNTAGYTDMFRLRNGSANAYTGMLNILGYNNSPTSCVPRAGLPQGHPYKAIDYGFSKYFGDSDIFMASKIGVPIGGFGNCAASDHLGIKVGVRVP